MLSVHSDEHFMQQAMLEAEKALAEGEVPIGAVVVSKNRIIARSHNLVERLTDVTAHAEMQAITAAANFLGSKYLVSCSLYVTLEPCIMCAGALYWSQLEKVVFAASDEKRGYRLAGLSLHPKTEIIAGVLGEESAQMLKSFFQQKRAGGTFGA